MSNPRTKFCLQNVQWRGLRGKGAIALHLPVVFLDSFKTDERMVGYRIIPLSPMSSMILQDASMPKKRMLQRFSLHSDLLRSNSHK